MYGFNQANSTQNLYLVWLQSSKFNPESVFSLAPFLSLKVVMLIGASLELAHLFEFGLLYLFLILAFLTYRKLSKKVEYIAIVISIMYGLIDEIHQHYVPFRSASLVDLFKDVIGVFAVWFIIHKSYFSNPHSKIGLMLMKINSLSRRKSSGLSC